MRVYDMRPDIAISLSPSDQARLVEIAADWNSETIRMSGVFAPTRVVGVKLAGYASAEVNQTGH